MNNQRRKQLKQAIQLLESAREIVIAVKDEEEEAMYNLPESLQDSDKAMLMQETVDFLDELEGNFDELVSQIEEVIS